MLLTKRRNSKRFEGTLFIEFRPLTGTASYALGLSKNFSWEGFCIEYQGFSLEPGDRLEFKLRQPRTNLFIGFMGDVIWKNQNDVNYSAGIIFKNIDIEFKEKMMEMLADSCNIPAESWRQSNNKRLRRKKINDNPVSDLDQKNETEYVPEEPRKGRITKKVFKMTVITATCMMVFFFPRLLENSEESTLRPVAEVIKAVPLTPDVNEQTREVGEGNPILTEQEKAEDRKPPVSITEMKENSGYYVQVASFKNSEIAFDSFQKITEHYPDAYLIRQDNFYKIRIPDIAAYAQGVVLLREIEAKFNLQSDLVQKTQ